MARTNSTRRKDAAKKLAAESGLTYMQALQRVTETPEPLIPWVTRASEPPRGSVVLDIRLKPWVRVDDVWVGNVLLSFGSGYETVQYSWDQVCALQETWPGWDSRSVLLSNGGHLMGTLVDELTPDPGSDSVVIDAEGSIWTHVEARTRISARRFRTWYRSYGPDGFVPFARSNFQYWEAIRVLPGASLVFVGPDPDEFDKKPPFEPITQAMVNRGIPSPYTVPTWFSTIYQLFTRLPDFFRELRQAKAIGRNASEGIIMVMLDEPLAGTFRGLQWRGVCLPDDVWLVAAGPEPVAGESPDLMDPRHVHAGELIREMETTTMSWWHLVDERVHPAGIPPEEMVEIVIAVCEEALASSGGA